SASGDGRSCPRTRSVAAGASSAPLPSARSKAIMFRLVRRSACSAVTPRSNHIRDAGRETPARGESTGREQDGHQVSPGPLAPEGDAQAPGPLFDFDHSEFEASLAADHANVEHTVRNLTRERVEACVSALAAAHRVMIVGMDQMAFFASYLRHLLALLDIRAEVIASPRQDSITRLSRVDEDSLVIAFSAGKAHPIVIRAMKLARHRRARTLAITDATLSEVGEHAELTLYYSSNSPSFSRSNT